MKFGLLIGRFQPFHIGHQAIINEILLDDRIPIIVYGSSNDDRDLEKNPLSYIQRVVLVESVYSGIPIIHVKSLDYKDWTTWYDELIEAIKLALHDSSYFRDPSTPLQEDIILYYTNKEIDRSTFQYKNTLYVNTWYTQIFKNQDFTLKEASFNQHSNLQISANARDIRANLEQNKHLLDARVYHKLKHWEWN